MKITFDAWNQNMAMDKVTTAYEPARHYSQRIQGIDAFSVDIMGNVINQNAYGEHGSAIKNIMQSLGSQVDIQVQRDYMTVMSNIVSTEDFNKMMKDGFDPSKIDPQQYVTIVDHIKAEMAKSGNVVAGYNDDMKPEEIEEALGSSSLAKEVERELRNANLPVNAENVDSMKETLEKAESISSYDEACKKYMVENHMEPTVENLYRAHFSASGDGSKQSRGYYAQEMPGYFAKKADTMDWESLKSQLEKTIEKMNLGDQTKEESLEQAKWLMERGIPVTEESMNALGRMDEVTIPLDIHKVIRAGVNALIEGKSASEGVLTGTQESIYEKAVRYTEEIKEVTDEDIKRTLERGEELNLKNLRASRSGKHTLQVFLEEKYITASRQLAEVQLKMTIDANIKLLRSDYAIDTAPLSELVEALREQEERMAAPFLDGEEGTAPITAKSELYRQTQNVLREIPSLPAAVLGRITYAQSISLSTLHAEGVALKSRYEAAGTAYETLMTSPRADMGDSIKKAFRNVDDILTDMNIELTEDNRKAVRILGYNRMEITEEAIREVKEVNLQVENVIKGMTPQRTLGMIREGINPLTMDLTEVEDYLKQADREPEEEMTKYSRFLYELEKKGEISKQERESYIGVYRLFHQIEKSDGAVIGSLMAQGADLTLGNLLTAVRNRKHGKMDYTIDDSFGSVQETVKKGKSISEQIEKGIHENRVAHSIFQNMEVSLLQQVPLGDGMTLEELRNVLNQTKAEPLSEEMAKDLLKEYRQDQNKTAQMDEEILNIMSEYDIPYTVENLLAAETVLTQKGQTVKMIKEAAQKLDAANHDNETAKALYDAEEEIIENFNDYDSAQEILNKWEMRLKDTLERTAEQVSDTRQEILQLYQNYKQLSVMGGMRKNESYEIPMEINGEMTSVNLTLVQGAEEKGTVSITMENTYFGKAGAKFKLSKNRIDGYFIADSQMGKDRLEEIGKNILATFEKEGMEVGDVHYVNAHAQGKKDWNPLTFSEHNDDNNNETVAARQLYQVAKTFLKGMRDFT